MTLANRHGKLSTGMLCADATSITRLKYATSASSCSRSTYCFFVVERLMLTTSKPCSIAHSRRPGATTPAAPPLPRIRARGLSSFDPMTTATDAELVARCRAGENAAWNELVERFSRYVYAIAVQAFRLPQHDAEDVFQEVFARVYEHLDRLRSDEAIRPWIAQLTRRLCIDRLRASGREGPADTDMLEPAEVDESLALLDEAMTVRGAMEAVGEACRDILDRF